MSQPEFDRYSPAYEELLRDPIRDRFAGAESGFFHVRKRDLIKRYFRDRKRDTRQLRYLDIGCGKGELVSLLREDFGAVAGCDPSPGMLSFAKDIDARVQTDPGKLPFDSGEFDFVSAVCVYHHVPLEGRLALTREVSRVLKRDGVFAIIEHNPFNPVTRRIVSRTPVDADAILLKPIEAREWMQRNGFKCESPQYFLYFPERVYRIGGYILEELLHAAPLGGQYAVFGTKASTELRTDD
jgi:SAM-dependent methyltransferase